MKEAASQIFHYRTLRTIVGGIAIAIAVITTAIFISNTEPPSYFHNVPTSISVTYHFGARDVFVGMLFIVGSFLVAYKGNNTGKPSWIKERYVATLAGITAILVAICPTTVDCDYARELRYDLGSTVCVNDKNKSKDADFVATDERDSKVKVAKLVAAIHGIAAILLITSLVFFCYRFYIRALKKLKYEDYSRHVLQKIQNRVKVYMCCGIAMLISPIIGFAWEVLINVKYGQMIFIIEIICLIAFGVAWLTAGKQSIFANKEIGDVEPDAIDIEEEISRRLEKEEAI